LFNLAATGSMVGVALLTLWTPGYRGGDEPSAAD
jgi:hypothetical protein